MKTNSAVLLLAGILSATAISAQTQIIISTPSTPGAQELVGVDVPSGLSLSQGQTAGTIGSNSIASNNVLTVGWTLTSAAPNVTITADIGGTSVVTAYLTDRVGTGTTASNEITHTNVVGSASQPTTIFTGLNLAAGNYYLTLTSAVTTPNPWYNVNSSPGPTITNQAGGLTDLFQGVTSSPATYPPASIFTSQNGQQQTGSPAWGANLFEVVSVQKVSLPAATQGTPYSVQFTATGGAGTITWSNPGGGLPPGVTLDPSSGLLSGTPTASGTYNFAVQATDARTNFSQTASTLPVNISGKVITTNLPAGMAIINISGTQDGAGASSGTNQSLWFQPFSNAGQLVEYTIQPGTYTFRVISPTDAAYTFPALTGPQLSSMWTGWTYNTPWLDDYLVFDSSAVSNSAESQLFSGAEGVPDDGVNSLNATTAYNWVIANGTYNNVYVGNRLVAPEKTYTFTFPRTLIFSIPDNAVTDNAGGVSVLIAPVSPAPLTINTTSLFGGQVGAVYSQTTFSASGGYGPPYVWSASGLPPGLTIGEAGLLSGTPTHVSPVGGFTTFFTVTDPVSGSSFTQTTPFHLTIQPASPALSISPLTLPQGEISVVYNQTISASGGFGGGYTWSMTAPSVTPALSINPSTGVITSAGPLTCCNTAPVSVTVTDAADDTATNNYTLLLDGPVSVSTTTLPAASVGQVYSAQFTASGGTAIYTNWAVKSGFTLPAGLSLSSTGLLSGTPTAAGSPAVNVTVTDSANGTASATLPLQILPGGPTISTTPLPAALAGESYGVQLVATGGTAPYTWSVATNSSLPAGFTLSASGYLSGTPVAAGTPGFSITVTDTATSSQTAALFLQVGTPVSYIAVNSSGGTVSLSPNASTESTIAPSTSGFDAVLDNSGNYIVAQGTQLARVTPSGNVSVFGVAPSGSTWAAVATDGLGNYIVADNKLHAVWRLSPDGAYHQLVATYPVSSSGENEDVHVLVDVHGNYVIAEDNNTFSSTLPGVSLFSITPAGNVTQIPLTGGTLPITANGLAFDKNGNYMLLDNNGQNLFQITPQGAVTVFATGFSNAGLARNPVTNDYYSGSFGALLKLSAIGQHVTIFGQNQTLLPNPDAVLAIPTDFPSAVEATNPLGYFRMEAPSGTSDVNGYTYSLNGGATVSNPGAPLGNPANNAVALDGFSGYVSTNLAGNIGTAGSIMAWINLSALPSNTEEGFNYIAGESTNGNDFDLQFSNSNVLGFYTTNNGSNLAYTPNPATLVGQWHMVVATFDAAAGTRAIYWDGSLVASDNTVSFTNKPGAFQIGSTPVFPSRYFNGSIDEAAVWNYSLMPGQVYALYASGAASSNTYISTVTPSSVQNQAADTPVTINGTNLAQGSTVWFTPEGGATTVLTPTAVAANQVTVTIPAAQLIASGVAQISVANAAGIPTNQVPFTVAANGLTIGPGSTTLSSGQVGQLYSAGISGAGGSGNYSWLITGQSSGFNMVLSPATGAQTTISGTPNVSNTDGGLSVTIQLTDTETGQTVSKTYFASISTGSGQNPPPVQGTQPPNTTAYVLNDDDGTIVSVTNGVPSPFVSSPGPCEGCFGSDMARDAAGNFIVAAGARLSRYTSTGASLSSIPTTVVVNPTSTPFFASVAVDSQGNYIVADSGLHQVEVMTSGGTVTAIYPYSISNSDDREDAYVRVDSAGNYVLIEDNTVSSDDPISLFVITPGVTPTGTPLTHVGLRAAEDSSLPTATGGFTFDAQGNYVNVDWNLELISRIAPGGGVTDMYVDNGVLLSDPFGIARDPLSGDFFIADDDNDVLFTLTSDGSTLSPIASGGLLTSPGPVVVSNVTLPPPTLVTWVLEGSNYIVPVGGGTTLNCPPTTCNSGANDFAVDAAGNFILASGNLVKVTQAGVSTVIAAQPEGSQFISVAVDSSGNYIVADDGLHRIVKVNPAGVISRIANYPTADDSESPEDVFVRIDGSGNYVVAEDSGSAVNIHRITTAGNVTNVTVSGRDPVGISGLALDGNGNYLISDFVNRVIDVITPAGAGSLLFANGNETLAFPSGMYRDPSSGNILLTDETRGALYSLTPNGVTLTQITSGLSGAAAVLIAPSNVAPLSITNTGLPSGVQGLAYSTNFAATGGSGNYTWSATRLPPGLALSADGILSGTPTASGSFLATVTVTDASNSNATATANVAVFISAPASSTVPTLTLSPPNGPVSTTVGGSFSASFTTNGGLGPYSYAVTGQPGGVSVDTGGTLSGSPTLAGNFTATLTVTDSRGATASALVTINVLGLTTTSLPAGTAGQFYSASITAIGGAGSYAFSATGLPAGLFLGGTGFLSGTVKTNGTYTLAVTVSSGGASVSSNLNITFAVPGPLAISSAALPDATVNVLYAKSFTATGGFPPYTWSVISGTLPQGLSMNSAGSVSGTATTPGAGSFGIQVADSAGATASAAASIAVDPAPLAITTLALPSGMVNVDYPQQVLGATGGVSPYTWSLSSGGFAAGVSLSPSGVVSGVPTAAGSFTPGITVTDSAGSKATMNPGLTIRPTSADLVLTAASLGFSLMTPASITPASQPVGVQSTVSTQVLSYSISVSSSAAWLSVTNGTSTPDTIQVSITPAALSLLPGAYQATVTATCTSTVCAGHTQTVSVALNVTAAAPKLQVGTTLLSFATTTSNTGAIGQSISLQNAGGGTIGFASMTCEDAWCTVGAPPALAGGASAAVPVTVDPSLLTPGFYRTQVDIATSAGNASVPVTLFIAPNSTMTLAPAGNQFNMPAGSAPGNSNGTFLVSVNNATPVNWTASVVPGASWLSLATTSGTSTTAQPGSIAFSINSAAAALAPGAYYGLIQVVSGDIANSPLDFEVVLNVVPATTPIVPDPEPGGLLFITTVGGVLPPQTINVYSGSVTPLTFQTSAAVTTGSGWLSVTPSTGSASAGSPGVTTVTVSTTRLKSGIYTGGISYSLSATAVRTVNVTLIVTNPGGTAAPSSVTRVNQPKALTCAPTALAAAQTGLVNNFSEPAAWPTPLVIQLSDDCGSSINNGQIVATFTNGDPPLILQLADPTKALYSGTWSPRKAASQVAINIRASAPGYPDATTQIAGAVVPNAAPILTPHGTLHSFDPLVGGALAPGTIVAIYGQNLASVTTQPTTIPLPTVSNGTTVLMGGLPAPLYYVSAGQINAQVPFELLPGQQYQVLVSANGALTTPDTIQLSAAAPGLAAFGDGTLIAQHGDGSLVSTSSPAVPGEYLVAYLAGLGDTNVDLTSGAASPSSPLAIPTDTPVLNINGGQYPLLFAGLTPGLVGLYQMNFQVPAGLPAGTITIVLSQGGASSNQTTLPYQP